MYYFVEFCSLLGMIMTFWTSILTWQMGAGVVAGWSLFLFLCLLFENIMRRRMLREEQAAEKQEQIKQKKF